MFVLFLLSALGLVVSLGIHLCTFLPGYSVEVEKSLLPQLFLCFFPLFFVAAKCANNDARRYGYKKGSNWCVPPDAPQWLIPANKMVLLYWIVNFALLMIHSGHDGDPKIQGGKYVMERDGTITKEITREEYHQRVAHEARGISGHLLSLYFFTAVPFFLRYRRPKLPTPT